MKFLDVFNPIVKGSHGFTDEAIYSSLNTVGEILPLYGGNSQHTFTERYVSSNAITIDGSNIRIFSGEGIIISLDGSSGSMTYKNNEKFTLNHHAGFITLNQNGQRKINLHYFSLFMQNRYKSLSVSDGTKTLSLSQIYSDDFYLPDKKVQDKIVNSLVQTMERCKKLEKIQESICRILNKEIVVNYQKYQVKNIKINDILRYLSGNSNLTEEFLYNNIYLEGRRYKILSSATQEENMLGEIPMCKIKGKKLKVFSEDRDGLLVIRKGKAGKTIYLTPGKYTLNDDAYILYVKEDCPYKIHLKWLSIQYKTDFLAYASSADNGTWNMTGFFNNVSIDIPDYEEQLKIVHLYERAENMQEKIADINNKLTTLLSKEIC